MLSHLPRIMSTMARVSPEHRGVGPITVAGGPATQKRDSDHSNRKHLPSEIWRHDCQGNVNSGNPIVTVLRQSSTSGYTSRIIVPYRPDGADTPKTVCDVQEREKHTRGRSAIPMSPSQFDRRSTTIPL